MTLQRLYKIISLDLLYWFTNVSNIIKTIPTNKLQVAALSIDRFTTILAKMAPHTRYFDFSFFSQEVEKPIGLDPLGVGEPVTYEDLDDDEDMTSINIIFDIKIHSKLILVYIFPPLEQ
ncbi:hypothetical protein ACJX0J_011860 [Zea mays]